MAGRRGFLGRLRDRVRLRSRLRARFDFSVPPLSDELHSTHYDSIYSGLEEYRVPYSDSTYYYLWAVIVDRVRRGDCSRILDIGCGPGQLAQFLLDRGVESYVGLDFSEVAIDMARRKGLPRAEFLVGDARLSDVYSKGPFDAVICTEVLEHVDDDTKIIERFPVGTRCLCTVPSFSCEGHVRYFGSAAEVEERYSRHFREFTVTTFPTPGNAKARFYLMDGMRG